MKKTVLILGGEGYIGSRLQEVLREHFTVDIVDICWHHGCLNPLIIRKDYSELSPEFLSKYDVIVVLAGHSSVKSCEGDIKSSWLNNVTNFNDLLKKLNFSRKIEKQLVIYASSASIYGNSNPGETHKENCVNFSPVNNYDITKYALDLLGQIAIDNGENVIGLRFGTVNGWSPNLRTDLMLNSMFKSALTESKVQVTNKHVARAVLGLEDLCNAILACIDNPNPGIYNLSSFNSTVQELADIVSKKLNVPIIDNGDVTGVYDFSLDNSKFTKTFNFKFEQTPETILDDLLNKYTSSYFGRRDKPILYTREKL